MAGKKTFVAGEVLLAQDVNDYLMDQSVMNFATSAARASAIPTPTEGMTSYISTTGTASIPQIETYTGSAWQTPYGLTLIANVSATAAASIIVDNVFTSTYTNYKVVFTGTSSTPGSLFGVLRAAGADIGGSGYFNGGVTVQFSTGGVTGRAGNGETFMYFTQTSGSDLLSSVSFDLINPQGTSRKGFGGFAFRGDSFGAYIANGETNFTTSATGIKIYPSNGTLTGTVQIYGYRNS
jgi:hypothetical protein